MTETHEMKRLERQMKRAEIGIDPPPLKSWQEIQPYEGHLYWLVLYPAIGIIGGIITFILLNWIVK